MRIGRCARALRTQSRRCLFVSSLALLPSLLVPQTSGAGPLIIEESAKLIAPGGPYDSFRAPVALDGNTILLGGGRPAPNPEFPSQIERTGFLFERNAAGTWQFVRKLVEQRTHEVAAEGPNYGFNVGINGGVATVVGGQVFVFERTAAGWVSAPATAFAQNFDAEVSSGMILASSVRGTCFDADLIQKAASGTWTQTRSFVSTLPPGGVSECDVDSTGGDVDITSNRVILGNDGEVQIWNRNSNGSFPGGPTSIVPLKPGSGFYVTIDGNDALATSGSLLDGPYVLRATSGNWAVAGHLLRPDRVMSRESVRMEMVNGIAAVGFPRDPDRNGSVAIFQRNASGNYDYVAKLVASDISSVDTSGLGNDVEISGRRVIANGFDVNGHAAAYVFDLPADLTQPALVQDDFEDRNAAEWTHIAGSTIAVVSNGSSFVYRQSGLAAAAGSVRTGVDMKNQAIDADAVPKQFATGDRWFGLTVRQTDANNYYYLTVRSTNAVSLRSLDNGAIRTLASAPLSVVLNHPYKLRLEAIGSRIRGYVDGRLVVEARDKVHTHGAPGLRMSKAAADYDNVVISPNPRLAIFKDDFEGGGVPQWFTHTTPYQGTWSRVTDGTTVFQQSSVASGARVTTGADADDQIVQVRVKATQFAAGSGDRWFGVLARMRDDNNTYYVTMRNNNTISLRKLVNGAIVTLDEAPLTVTLGTWYTLRLEAIGTSLRTYVNGRLVLEAIDSTHPSGTYGLATSKTAARFDDVVVSQP